MRTLTSLVILSVVVVAPGWAGTMYINFDGDDGTGSSLPAGVVPATWVGEYPQGAPNNPAGYYLSPVFDGSRASVPAGGGIIFDPAWTNGVTSDSPLIVEYTVTDLQAQYASALYSGPLLGWNVYNTAGGLASMGSIIDGYFAWGTDPTHIHIGIYGVPGNTDVEATHPASTKVTIRLVFNGEGSASVYAAFDDNATTPASRPRLLDMQLMNTVVVGDILTDAYSFSLGNWVSNVSIDDVIVEGPSVPDFGTPPAQAGVEVKGNIVVTPSRWVEVGMHVEMLAPATTADPTNYTWRKDGVPLIEDSHITGVNARTLVIDPVAEEDAGTYTVSYEDGSTKALIESDPCELQVFQPGSLPVGGVAGLALLTASVLCSASVAIRRKRQ